MTNAQQPKTSGTFIAGVVILVASLVGGFFGLLWIVTFYLTQGSYPIASIGTWNLVFGSALWLLNGLLLILAIILMVVGRRKNPVLTT
jgi:hypothetical protein